MKYAKKIKTSLSVTFKTRECMGFEATTGSQMYPDGLTMTYTDSPQGIMVESGDDHIWVNLANIPHIVWEKEVKKPKAVNADR